ncbi:MAG: SDR family oxidoreductase, partial [Alphaproteobacteria bacterium]|nr:SDR family oxidoreductase [Alphaproteobacteria bacterium]
MAAVLMMALKQKSSGKGSRSMTQTGTSHGVMHGKKGLIMGVANDRSIAWGIAAKLAEQGAELAFTFQGEALQKRVTPLAASVGSDLVMPCDVTDEASMDAVFSTLAEKWGKLDFVLHAIAYSDKEELKGGYVDTSRQNFQRTMDISVYSFTAVAKRAAAMMNDGGSMLTLTYYGAERVMPHYNVMGVAKAALEASIRYLAVDLGGRNIRVNGLSAGPMKTLAASGIGDFRYILKWNQYNSPLKRNVTLEEILALPSVTNDNFFKRALKELLWDERTQHSFALSGFQKRSLDKILRAEGETGIVVTAGTGSGKTLAFYLPALLEIAKLVDRDNWVKAVAVYPRTELLKDQFMEAFKLARKLDDFQRRNGKRKIRIGAYYSSTPMNHKLVHKSWSRFGDGFLCPWLSCPVCENKVIWETRYQ